MNESMEFKKDYKKGIIAAISFIAAVMTGHFIYEVFILENEIQSAFNDRSLSVFLVPPITLVILFSVFPKITKLKISDESIIVSSRFRSFESKWSDISSITHRPHKGRLFSLRSKAELEIYIPEKEFSSEDEKLIETTIIDIANENGVCVNV